MASLFNLFGRTLFVFLLGAGVGYAVMAELLERSVPEAAQNKNLIRYREIFMIAIIVLAIVCMCLVLFT
jgi:Trk-type K+ transport system membrane component